MSSHTSEILEQRLKDITPFKIRTPYALIAIEANKTMEEVIRIEQEFRPALIARGSPFLANCQYARLKERYFMLLGEYVRNYGSSK